MATLFISDLHLDDARPEIIALFESFLAGEARHADALYILGDLFEAWIGDDDDAPLPARVASALKTLRDSGVPIYFIAGNRDFLLGSDYAKRAGMTVHDLVKVTQYLLRAEDIPAYAAVRKRFLGDARPASMLLVSDALP